MSRNDNSQMFKTSSFTDILLSAFGRAYLTTFISAVNILGSSSIGKLGN